jgi:ElaB/YqjD/DUF883 family membrane-anchored ribosome-binding protein
MADDYKSEQEQFADTVKEAVATIKASMDDFTKAAADSRDNAASAVKKAGSDAIDQLHALSGDAQAYMGKRADMLATSVAANPFAALAIAASAGYLFGLAMRGSRR